VYSTCSVYVEENERVVARALEEGRARGFELVSCIQSWGRRGIAEDGGLSAEDARKVLRVDPLVDGTDGFFVAVWRRNVP
jgi:16S rRNA C967 or C1407 C5-methylase (RsmB/RsmF family)